MSASYEEHDENVVFVAEREGDNDQKRANIWPLLLRERRIGGEGEGSKAQASDDKGISDLSAEGDGEERQ